MLGYPLARYRTVRRYLPALLEHIHFGANAEGKPVVAVFEWLQANMASKKAGNDAPCEVVGKSWQWHVVNEDGCVDFHAHTVCVLEELQVALKRRDVFVAPSWRYADPRAGLLDGAEWDATRPIICRTSGLSADPEPTLTALASELDLTYRAVAARLPDNAAVRFDMAGDKHELVLSPLDKLDEPVSLLELRTNVAGMLPRVDLPELTLEIESRTGFTDPELPAPRCRVDRAIGHHDPGKSSFERRGRRAGVATACHDSSGQPDGFRVQQGKRRPSSRRLSGDVSAAGILHRDLQVLD